MKYLVQTSEPQQIEGKRVIRLELLIYPFENLPPIVKELFVVNDQLGCLSCQQLLHKLDCYHAKLVLKTLQGQ